MIRELARGVARRLLTAAGLVRAAELDQARRAVMAAERERASRVEGAATAKLKALDAKLRSARERATSEHAALRTTLGLLRHYLIRLEHMETEVANRVALERRVKRSQLAIAVRAARRQPIAPAAAADAARLAALAPAYGAAVCRWQGGDVPADIHRVTIAGLRWSVPPGATRESSSAKRTIETWLPFHDFGTIRQFVVGGVMLDLGAGVGAAALPRVLLGDFTKAYAAEPDTATYLCLVGNTLDNHLEGRVLPDCVALGGFAGPEVPSLSIDDWMERLGVGADAVRFVRIALQAWNLSVLEGAAHLLKRHDVVWQLEIPRSLIGADAGRVDALVRQIAAHFTNVKELGRYWAEPWRPASEVGNVVRAIAEARRPANLLLFNLPGAHARPRARSAGASATRVPMISLLHPTARLPEGWKPAMQAFLAKARDPEHVEYVLAVNEGESFSLPTDALRGWGRSALVQEGVTGPNSGFNSAARVSTGDILMTIADDYFPPDEWDEQIRAAIPDITEEVVLDVENSDGVARLLPFSILTRPYYERYGYILYPGYHGFFGDNEFTEQARRDRVIRSARHIVFEHRHPDRGTAPMDEIYARQRSHFDEGKKLFKERKAKGFPKWPD